MHILAVRLARQAVKRLLMANRRWRYHFLDSVHEHLDEHVTGTSLVGFLSLGRALLLCSRLLLVISLLYASAMTLLVAPLRVDDTMFKH